MTHFAGHKGPDLKPKKPVKSEKQPYTIKRSKVKIKKHSETSLRALLNLARIVIQKWVVYRDREKPCISCGKVNCKIYGTHYLKAEIYSGLIFHEHNINGGCDECNRGKDGNTSEYRKGLIKRIGRLRVERLENIADANREYKYSREELNNIIKKYTL